VVKRVWELDIGPFVKILGAKSLFRAFLRRFSRFPPRPPEHFEGVLKAF